MLANGSTAMDFVPLIESTPANAGSEAFCRGAVGALIELAAGSAKRLTASTNAGKMAVTPEALASSQ
jgi:hypothetical protein